MKLIAFLLLILLVAGIVAAIMAVIVGDSEFEDFCAPFEFSDERRLPVNILFCLPLLPLYIGRGIRKAIIFVVYKPKGS